MENIHLLEFKQIHDWLVENHISTMECRIVT